MSLETFKDIYKSYGRTVFAQAVMTWSPYFQNHINSIEKVQHRFLRHCAFKNNNRVLDHNYAEIEKQMSLAPLSTRRDMFGAIFIFKLLNGQIDCADLLSQVGLNIPYQGLRHLVTF